MERITLREAAQRTSRSITTLRRYIRSGRLRAEKRFGRFGPEYFISTQDLVETGLAVDPANIDRALARREDEARAVTDLVPQRLARNAVPLALYQDLQMKHEQLLVQYGMVRASGLRVMELQARLEEREQELEQSRAELQRVEHSTRLHTEQVEQQLREAHLELEGRALEISALKEKVRALEMLTRNAVTNETIERQYHRVMDQRRRVEELGAPRSWKLTPSSRTSPDVDDSQDH